MQFPINGKNEVKKKNVCLKEKKSCTIFNVKNNLKHIGILQTKEIYKRLYTHPEEPFCIKYWEKEHLIENCDWSSTFSFKIKNRITNKIGHFQYNLRGGFKTQLPVDRQFRPVPGGCYCLEQ